MKKLKIVFISIAALTMLVLVGCNNNQPSAAENPDAPDYPVQVPQILHAHNVAVINTSHEATTIPSGTLSIEDATGVGIQYIYDIFGENVTGMYVELSFTDWEHMTRTLWHGAVSANYRYTLENRVRLNELNDIFAARLEAGEYSQDIFDDMSHLFDVYGYSSAHFYFAIDAVTGERIDIWKTMPAQMQNVRESIPLHEYIEQEWDGDWDMAFSADIDPDELDELIQLAEEYAQKQFYNSTISNVHFGNASTSFVYIGGGFNREPFAHFTATNDTGRIAQISIHVVSRTVTSINTMSNDFIPIDDGMRGER